MRCFTTQIRGLIVCPYREGDEPIPKTSFKDNFSPDHVDLQTQLGYLHTSTSMATADRFALVQSELCAVDRRTLYNKLQAIAGAHNPYALLDLYGRGHQVSQAGAAVYVTRCVEVDVPRVEFPNCTQEVPVGHENGTWFVDAFTRILTPFPTVVPCSDLMPVRWKLSDQWYCAHPQVLPCHDPKQLNTTVTPFVSLHDFTLGMGEGVYSADQRRQHRRYQVAMSSRKPVLAKITNVATNGGTNGHLGIPLSAEDIHGLSFDVAFHLFPMIYFLGEAWTYLSSFLMVLLLGKIVVGAAIRGFMAFRRYGCGRWVVFSLWETLFVIATTPWRLVTKTADALTADLEENGIRRPDAEALAPTQEADVGQGAHHQAPLLLAAALPHGIHHPQ